MSNKTEQLSEFYLARWLNSIFTCLCEWQEAIVLGAGVFLEAWRIIWKIEWVRHLWEEALLWKTTKKDKIEQQEGGKAAFFLRYLKFSIVTDRNVVQVLYTAFNSNGFTHLNHGGALFGFQKFNSSYIACKDKEKIFIIDHSETALPTVLTIQANEIEELVCARSHSIESVDHHDSSLLLVLCWELRCCVTIGSELWWFLHETLRCGCSWLPWLWWNRWCWRRWLNCIWNGAIGLCVVVCWNEGVTRGCGA